MKIPVIKRKREEIPVHVAPDGTERIAPLRVADRCDRCGAQAFVAALVSGTRLQFCGHHFRQHESALRPIAEALRDERWRLTKGA